jgi:hypothetical protein
MVVHIQPISEDQAKGNIEGDNNASSCQFCQMFGHWFISEKN